MLSTPGVGSGLNISSIIEQLMTLEQRPLVALGAEQIELEAQLSGVGALKNSFESLSSSLSDLRDADQFRFNQVNVADDDVLTATASAEAGRGTFQLEVQRIAEYHRMAANTAYADADTTRLGIDGDTLTISVGPDDFIVDIGDMTLTEIRDAINTHEDNLGVTASLLQDDDGYRLTLSADETGSDNFIALAYSGADTLDMQSLNLDRDGSTVFDAADLDAVLLIENTFTATRTRNTISDVIDGVTLNLVGAGTTSIDIARDNNKIVDSVQRFVGSYNEVFQTLNGLRQDVLASDRAALNSLESQLRSQLSAPASGSESYSFLFELGITTQLDGSLALERDMLETALTTEPDAVSALFTNIDDGFAVRLKSFADSVTSAGGVLDGRQESLNSQIRQAEDDRVRLEARLALKEEALVSQFSALDALIAGLTTTSDFLSTQLEQIEATARSSIGN